MGKEAPLAAWFGKAAQKLERFPLLALLCLVLHLFPPDSLLQKHANVALPNMNKIRSSLCNVSSTIKPEWHDKEEDKRCWTVQRQEHSAKNHWWCCRISWCWPIQGNGWRSNVRAFEGIEWSKNKTLTYNQCSNSVEMVRPLCQVWRRTRRHETLPCDLIRLWSSGSKISGAHSQLGSRFIT